MPITKARINLGAVVKKVAETDSQVVLERDGHPVAAVVSIDMLESMLDGLEIARLKKTETEFHAWDDIKHEYGL